MEILTAKQMRQIDRRAVRTFGVPEIVLMENAGLRLLEFLLESFSDLKHRRIVLLCGRGNNGGDALVLARHLRQRGIPFTTLLFGRPGEMRGSAGVQVAALRRVGLPLSIVSNAAGWRRSRRALQGADLVVDGIFGTGLSRPVAGWLAGVFDAVSRSGATIVAVDIPSGLSGDTADIPGPAIHADHTVTFVRPKMPHIFLPARALCGKIHVADIAIPEEAVRAQKADLELLEAEALRAFLPDRRAGSHKGDFGHVLLVAGSRGKGGAARLAALGALRAGCGLLTVAVPESLQGWLLKPAMEAMTEGLPETATGSLAPASLPRLIRLLEGKSAVAIGPGLSTHPETMRLVRAFVARVRVPLVIDADGLNAFAGSASLLSGAGRSLLLTPHPGEMGRLIAQTARAVQDDRIGHARRFARRHRCHLILKGHQTVIAAPDGRVSINPTGNPGMAKGGSGDVLTGLLAGLLGQGLTASQAAAAGVYLHGLAGDLASARLGETSVLARDILAQVPHAFVRLRGASTPAARGVPA